jgi:transcriptional regulator with GAF, ATPase, and Fis domain
VEHRSLITAREQFERKYIQKALLKNAWDTARTAAELKIDEAALGAKIKALGITFID